MTDLRFALCRPTSSSRLIAACGLACLFLGLSLPALPAGPAPADGTVPPLTFALKDQFDREYTQALCAGKIAIVFEADREGSKFSGQWSAAIAAGLKSAASPAVQWVSVAELPSVPGFLQGFVKSKFPQDKTQWTLLDWHGRFIKMYGLPSDRCNVLVFAADGRFLLRIGGREVDPAAVSALVAAVAAAAPNGKR